MNARVLLAVLAFGAGCVGSAGAGPKGQVSVEPPPDDGPGDPALFGRLGLRRLSQAEYRATVRDLTGVDVLPALELLPADASSTFFDVDWTSQVSSPALVEGLNVVAKYVADRVAEDAALRARILPCAPSGPGDGACFRHFVRAFGRRALRRPLTDAEIDRYAALQRHAVAERSFAAGVALVLRVVLQEMELVYRVESGTPVSGRPGLQRLDDFALAARLSYFLSGSTPDDELLARAERGELRTSAGLRAAAARLLSDPRAEAQVARLHAAWLAYDRLPHEAKLSAAMRQESDALVRKIVFQERRPWTDLFTASETFVDARLAKHYGLAAPADGGARWVAYGESPRRGLLSHGSVLSNGIKFGDTSPVQRGIFVRNRLFCQDIPPPMPNEARVNVDEPPQAGSSDACKADRYEEHRLEVGCARCHKLMDPIGMGLERFDGQGRYRTVEPKKPACPIDGKGEVVGTGGTVEFSGPGELGAVALTSGALVPCFVAQLWEYALGRPRRAREDGPALAALTARFAAGGRYRLDEWLLELVSSSAFRHRLVE